MAQAIKQFNGTTYGPVSVAYTTVYTCPSDTVAIVLPNCMFIPTYSGGTGALGYNSSSVSDTYSDYGNFLINGGDVDFPYQITHDDKHRVRIGLMNQNTDSNMYYSPNWTTNITSNTYALKENREPWTNSTYGPHFAAIVGGQMGRSPNSNGSIHADDLVAGTWVMGAGHKLTLSAQLMRIQYSFLIIEEAAS